MTQEQKDKPECLIVFSCFNRLIVDTILFAHENVAFRVGDFLWRARRKTLAVVILQQVFPTQLSEPGLYTSCVRHECYIFMCGEYITVAATQKMEKTCQLHKLF
jgi:hypothetical protein